MKENMSIEFWREYLIKGLQYYLPKFVLATIFIILGWYVISKLTLAIKKILLRRNIDITLIPFLVSVIDGALKVLLIVGVGSMVGVATTSFVAVLGAAGLAVGLALQGSLANFAGGVLILLFKPFKVGDLVLVDGILGTVKEINILNTLLVTPDENTAIFPNGNVANNKMINYTKNPVRRVDFEVGVSYKSNIDEVKHVILSTVTDLPNVLETPAPFVGLQKMADSALEFKVMVHVQSEHFLSTFYRGNEAIKKALDKAGIEIPFPQRDLHIFDNKS